MKIFLIIFSICSCLIGSLRAEENGMTFYLSFDKPDIAAFAKGAPNALKQSHPGKLIPGVKGMAMQLEGSDLIKYTSKDNYDNARGSLSMWIMVDNKQKGSFYAFREGKGNKKPELRINYIPAQGGFFITHHYCFGKIITSNTIKAWNNLVITWDKNIGAKFYLNGKFYMIRPKGECDLTAPFLKYQRPAKTSETFSIGGNCNQAGRLNDVFSIDELKIYDRVLTEKEINENFNVLTPVKIKLAEPVLDWKNSRQKLIIKNTSEHTVKGALNWRIFNWSKTNPPENIGSFGKPRTIELKSGEVKEVSLQPEGLTRTGRYCVNAQIQLKDCRIDRSMFFVYFSKELQKQEVQGHSALKLKLLKEFDCAKTYGVDEFCDDGMSKVVDSSLGKYRTTGDVRYSRFAYRFFVEKVGKPHVAEVLWPDNHEFEMEVVIDSKYGGGFHIVDNGIIAGQKYPNTNKLKTYKLIFWPPHKECTIQIVVHPEGGPRGGARGAVYPAAAKSIKIYQVDNAHLPAVKLTNLPPSNKQRTVGVEDEDCSTRREFSIFALDHDVPKKNDKMDFSTWYSGLTRRFDYMKFVGQNLFGHTVYHYRGTIFPGICNRFTAQTSWYPDFWLDTALYLASRKGLRFNAGMCFLDIPELKAMKSKVSNDDIIAGKDTVRNISWNGPAGGKIDHMNLDKLAASFNILHPETQKLYLKFFDDFMTRYGHYEAFNGIDIWGWVMNSWWFGSLKYGYSDYNIKLFKKETGIKVPGTAPDKDRFAKRYSFLVRQDKAMKEKWIAWRCEKVHQFWMKVYDIIQEKRPGTKLTFQTWALAYDFRVPHNRATVWKRGDVMSIYNFYREAGFDLDLFKDIPNLYIGNVFLPNFALDKQKYFIRDFEFAEARIEPFKNKGLSAIWLEQSRRETWRGKASVGTPMPDYWLPEGNKSFYPAPRKKRPIIDSVWKSPPIMPNSDYYLEYYAKCLADWDVREITDGGIGTTTLGAEDVLREFIRAYLTLPTEYFEVFKDVNDPVCVRYWKDRFYIVNREFYPIEVKLQFNKGNFKLHNLATDKKFKVDKDITITVNAFRLLSYKIPEGVKLASVQVIVPREKIEWLKGRLDKTLISVVEAKKKENIAPLVKKDLPWFERELQNAWNEKHYARLRQLLDSYWAQNIEEDKFLSRFFDQKFNLEVLNSANPAFAVKKVGSIPLISAGKWQNVPAFKSVFCDVIFHDGKCLLAPVKLKTVVKCVYTDRQIAFLFECQSNKMSKDDVVEIFVSPNKESKPYYQFRLGFEGYKSEKRCNTKYKRFGKPRDYSPKYDFQTLKKDGGFLALVIIPFAELDGAKAPEPGDTWRLNLGRQISDPQAFAGYYSQGLRYDLQKGFHCPDKFAKLVF